VDTPARNALETIVRAETGLVQAALIKQFHDFDLAEDAYQDAVAEALCQWGNVMPSNPGAWLMAVAKRRAIDRLRRMQTAVANQAELEVLTAVDDNPHGAADEADTPVPDYRLQLIFTCCHPALALPARVALTLRTLGGLTTEDIARAFLTNEKTMAQRLVRAKRKIKAAGIPYAVPGADDLVERLGGVLAALYLIFNEGYSSHDRTVPARWALCDDAIRLTRVLASLVDDPEATGLLSMMLLLNARRDARTDGATGYVPLEAQDPNQWNRDDIAEGLDLLRGVSARDQPGPYQTEAAIAAAQVERLPNGVPDWMGLAALYAALEKMKPGPVVRLNLGVAIAAAYGVEEGLAILNDPLLATALSDYQPYHAAVADLWRRFEEPEKARAAYDVAIALSRDAVVRGFLERRRARLAPPQ